MAQSMDHLPRVGLVGKLAFASVMDESECADDLRAYQALYLRQFEKEPPSDNLEGILNDVSSLFPSDLSKLEATRFEANAQINAQRPFYLAPKILFALFSLDSKRLWSTVRQLLEKANDSREPDFFEFLGLLFETRTQNFKETGLEIDGTRAHQFYTRGRMPRTGSVSNKGCGFAEFVLGRMEFEIGNENYNSGNPNYVSVWASTLAHL
jgi:hypothetical protein